MRIKFVGGPMNGEMKWIEEPRLDVQVHLPSVADSVLAKPVEVGPFQEDSRTGVYRYHALLGCAPVMRWVGEI